MKLNPPNAHRSKFAKRGKREMCSFGSCQTRFEFLSQFRKVWNAFECFVTQVQMHLPKTKRVWPMKINVICTVGSHLVLRLGDYRRFSSHNFCSILIYRGRREFDSSVLTGHVFLLTSPRTGLQCGLFSLPQEPVCELWNRQLGQNILHATGS